MARRGGLPASGAGTGSPSSASPGGRGHQPGPTHSDLASTAQQFGVGVPWELPISAFVGSMRQPGEGNSGERAADMSGTGSVRVSPRNMALIAAAVQSGSWHQPSLVVDASEPGQTPRHPFKSLVISQLRQLMAQTVASGAARGARVPGAEVFGQVGSAKILARADLRAIWFVGYRGNVAFAVLAFSRYPDFTPAVNVAHTFAAALQGSS